MNKIYLFTFTFILSVIMNIAQGAPAGIFKGTFMKLLPQDGIEFKDDKKIISGSTDPSSSATDADQGSLYLFTTKTLFKQDNGSSTNWAAFLLGPGAGGTDECIARWDGTGGILLQDSVVCVSDAGAISGATQLDVDNVRIDGNTISSTDVNGDILLSPNGTGSVNISGLTASRPLKLDASDNVISGEIDLASSADVTGILPVANGGTNSNTALNNDRIIVSSGGSIVEAAALTNGQMLIGSTGAAPVAATVSGTTNQVNVATGAGSLTLSTPQDIHTGASPTFVGATLSGLTASEFVKTDGSSVLTTVTSIDLTADVSGILPLANGGTNKNMTASNGSVSYSDADSLELTTVGTSGQPLLSGGAGAPTWFSSSGVVKATSGVLSTSNVDLTSDVTGILPMANGGTNKNMTASNGSVAYSDADSLELSAVGTSGQALVSGGAAAPTWFGSTGVVKSSSGVLSTSNVDLTSEVTGILPVANGGTNSSAALNNDRIMISNGGAVVENAALTNGQLLIGSTGAAPAAATISATADQTTVTNGAGTITVGTVQDINTTSSPTFTGATLSGLTQNSILFAGASGVISEDNTNFTFNDGTDTFDLTGQLNADNLRLDGNTLSSTTGDLILNPTGTEEIDFNLALGNFKFDQPSGALTLQYQTTGQPMQLELYSADGDGTDSNGFRTFGLGTPGAITNSEFIDLLYSSGNTQYQLKSNATGTGTVRPIVIETGSNTDQIYVDTDGDVGFNTDTPTEKIEVNGNIATQAQGDLRLQDSTGGEYVALQAPATVASNVTLTLPDDTPAAGEFLKATDGSGNLEWASSTSLTHVTKSSSVTLATTGEDAVSCDAGSGTVTLTLPAASGNNGLTYRIDKTDSSANECILDGNASETIDGSTTLVMWGQHVSVQIVSDGTNWITISRDLEQVAAVLDQKPDGTNGGTCTSDATSGGWDTRDLDSLDAQGSGWISLASNQITLQAGSYFVSFSAPSQFTDYHQARFRNVDDSSTTIAGSAEYTENNDSHQTRSMGAGFFTITAEKDFEIQHQCGTTQATNGYGIATTFTGVDEIYTIVQIKRLD